MTKKERIAALEAKVAQLERQVTSLRQALGPIYSYKPPPPLWPPQPTPFNPTCNTLWNSLSEVQKAWNERFNTRAPNDTVPKINDHTKGPLPYAHKTGHTGKMTVGDSHE